MTTRKIGEAGPVADAPPVAVQKALEAPGLEQQRGVNPHARSEGVPGGFRARPNAERIPCPALVALYNNGLLKPASDGKVETKHLDDVLSSIGVGKALRAILVRGANGTDELPDSFNLFNLRDSNLDHTGSSGIRDPQVRPEKVDDLLRFGENGRMYSTHFAKAANFYHSQDPGLRGTAIQTTEFTAILEVFGRKDESGQRYFNADDVKGLWIRGELPKDWQPQPRDSISLARFTGSTLSMLASRIWHAVTGLFRS